MRRPTPSCRLTPRPLTPACASSSTPRTPAHRATIINCTKCARAPIVLGSPKTAPHHMSGFEIAPPAAWSTRTRVPGASRSAQAAAVGAVRLRHGDLRGADPLSCACLGAWARGASGREGAPGHHLASTPETKTRWRRCGPARSRGPSSPWASALDTARRRRAQLRGGRFAARRERRSWSPAAGGRGVSDRWRRSRGPRSGAGPTRLSSPAFRLGRRHVVMTSANESYDPIAYVDGDARHDWGTRSLPRSTTAHPMRPTTPWCDRSGAGGPVMCAARALCAHRPLLPVDAARPPACERAQSTLRGEVCAPGSVTTEAPRELSGAHFRSCVEHFGACLRSPMCWCTTATRRTLSTQYARSGRGCTIGAFNTSCPPGRCLPSRLTGRWWAPSRRQRLRVEAACGAAAAGGRARGFGSQDRLWPVRLPAARSNPRAVRMACACWRRYRADEPMLPTALRAGVEPRRCAGPALAESEWPRPDLSCRLFDGCRVGATLPRATTKGQAAAEWRRSPTRERGALSARCSAAGLDRPRAGSPPCATTHADAEHSLVSLAIHTRRRRREAPPRGLRRPGRDHVLDTAVLSAAFFRTASWLERTLDQFAPTGLRVLVPDRLPPTRAISFGQAAVAAAL